MKSTLALAVLMLPAAVVAQPSPAPHQGPSWDLAKGAPRVDANRRFLVHADEGVLRGLRREDLEVLLS